MLLRQHGCRHKDRHLLAIHHSFEGGAQGHLGFAIAHVAAQQTIHRARRFHIAFDVCQGALLVFGLHVRERIFQFLLPGGIRLEGIALHHVTPRVQVEHLLRDLRAPLP